jgi:hypothetical protein
MTSPETASAGPAPGVLTMDDLFDHRGSERLAYSARCGHLSGGWLQLETLVTRNHDGSRWLAVDRPGACPDCSAVPVAALQLPGFEPPAGLDPDRPLRLRGRLSYGFAVDADGQASFLRLEEATLVPAEGAEAAPAGASGAAP